MVRSDRALSRTRAITVAIIVAMLGTLGVALGPSAQASNCARTSVGFTPLNDLGSGQYHGYVGGLYPGGSNVEPASHKATGVDLAGRVAPLNRAGAPDAASGKIVFLSIGMSNARDEFDAFETKAQTDPLRDPHVLVVNGAAGGQSADVIADPYAKYWNDVNHTLTGAGVSAAQVQAVWLKEATHQPTAAFPQDAVELKDDLQSIAKILKERFPNLWSVYLSSRIYAGFATSNTNPEPFAYQSGFAVKWLIQDQIEGRLPVAADQYPWLSWGPYLWADGLRPRSDGLTWTCADFGSDGTHPSDSGRNKVADMILDFVHSDETARAWYAGVGAPGNGCQLPWPLTLFRFIICSRMSSSVSPLHVGRNGS